MTLLHQATQLMNPFAYHPKLDAGPSLAAILFCLAGAALFCLILSPVSEASLFLAPRQRLEIAFDLDAGLLRVVSRIEIPADTEERIIVGDLPISAILVDDQTSDLRPSDGAIAISPSPRSRIFTLTFEKQFSGPPENPAGLVSEGGISLTGFWHPVLDSDCLYELEAVIPSNFEAVSEAEEIVTTLTSQGDKKVLFRFPWAVPSLNFVAGPYVVEKVPFGEGATLYTYFFAEDQGLAAAYRTKVLGYLERYARLLGPYPYKRFSVVENRLPTGYAMPSFTLLGQAVLRLPFIQDTSLGHEVLHEWFGNSVAVDYDEGNWAEGLATYLADQSFAEERGEGAAYRKDLLVNYASYVEDTNNIALMHFKGTADGDIKAKKMRAVGYGKASMVFHMLKQSLGADIFHDSLKDFFARMKHKKATWSDLKISFENKANTNLDDFFEQWLTQPDVPRLYVKDVRVTEREGRPLVSFVLGQQNKSPYRLLVPIFIKTNKGTVEKTMIIANQESRIEIPVDGEPLEFAIDEHYDLVRRLVPDEIPPVWSLFQGATERLAVVNSDRDAEIFKPFIEQLAGQGCKVMAASEVTDQQLQKASVIFFGLDGALARGLFALRPYPETGFTLEVKNNPLNPAQVAVLVSAANAEEVIRALPKLAHYGKYSFLHFEDGRNLAKTTEETDAGQAFLLDALPRGVPLDKTLDFAGIINGLASKKIVYVGEIHTNYEDHRLQLQIIRALYEQDKNLAIGMEMFERPVQKVLDDYIAGRIDEPTFLRESHYFKRWGFDYRLYREILDFARRQAIPVVALNIQKELVDKVFKGQSGISELAPEEREALPLDRDLAMPGYRERIEPVFSGHGGHSASGNFSGFLQAQAVWDETMAESVAEFLKDRPDHRMVVIAGGGHVAYGTGIPKRVFRRNNAPFAVVMPHREGDVEPEVADYLVFVRSRDLPNPVMLGVSLTERDNQVVIEGFSPHGKAKDAGLKEQDSILALDGQPVHSMEDLKIHLLYKEKGQSVKVLVKRPGTFFFDETIEIVVGL